MLDVNQLHEGQQVYVIYRNPHTPTVSAIQEATIAFDPMNPGQMSLVLFDYYHPIEEDDAIFSSYEEAEASFDEYMM
ncbi:transcriptional regulator SplA domain-containing protein [Alkalihalophilus sp. As8PL]|jgi:transcriptional regulator of the spore photoproduct lyase operon|uniref:Transcriptional regulator SplA domain-containing protein n=2 Tax=Alkalihalophilus TaxID=2893060 RepID=A0AB39BQA2_9BACI|nr:transcriptional regulator SplA domain-containing protein [Alkalihalophilus lindianensis]MDV2684133.1 transcriptional regulator SplA domain-containing protein [Alkalihalophilus lindianensis]